MKRIIPILLAVMVLSIPVGYALSYTGSAECSAGPSDGSCIIVESCVRDGDIYTPSGVFTEKATVSKSNNLYTMSATDVLLTPSSLYLHIYGIGIDEDITVSALADVTGVGSCTVSLDDTVLSSDRTVPQGYHKLAVTYSGTYSGASMPTAEISLSVYATVSSTGSYVTLSEGLRLKADSPSSVLEILEDSNPEIVASEDYGFSTNTSVNHGNNYPAANIANENNNRGGISDNQGNIDLEITIPSGPAFVLYLRTSGNNTFQLTMTKGDQVLVSGTVTFNSGIGTSGYYLSSHSSDGSSSGYFYSSINNVNTYNAWMNGDSEDIKIRIVTEDGQEASRNLKMDIVFRKE